MLILMVNIMTTRNFRSWHFLIRRPGMVESHVNTTADGHCTASVYSSLDFYLFFMFWSLVNLLRAFIFPIQFQHTYFCSLLYSWRILFVLVANVFIVLTCLQVSATVRCFLTGWVDLTKKRRTFLLATLVLMPPLKQRQC